MQKQTPRPISSNRRVRSSFARAAVHMAFGRHAGALDQGDFQDRKPWEMPMRSPTARFR